MEDTTIPSAPEGAAPVDTTALSFDEADSAIAKILTGNNPSKEDNVAAGEARSSEVTTDDDETLVLEQEDDEDQPQNVQEPTQPQEPGDDIVVTLSNGQKVPLGDLKKSPFFQRDYTFKLEGLKKKAGEFDTWMNTEVQRISQLRDHVIAAAQKHLPQPPDRSLADPRSPNYDPFTYQEQQLQYQVAIEEMNALNEQKTAQEQAFQKRYDAELGQFRAQELERFYLGLPKLRDEGKRNAFFSDVRTIVPQAYPSLKADDLLGLENADSMRLVHDAIQFRKALQRSQKVEKELPGKPKLEGKQRSSPQSEQARDMQGRFKALRESNGSFDSAQKAIEAILSR